MKWNYYKQQQLTYDYDDADIDVISYVYGMDIKQTFLH